MSKDDRIALVILAAGKGVRFASKVLKQYAPIAGVPVYIAATRPFLSACEKQLSSIVVVCPESFRTRTIGEVRRYLHTKVPVEVIAGGRQRIDSIFNAVGFLSTPEQKTTAGTAIIHDGVRPLIHQKDIKACISDFKRRALDASVMTKPVSESLFRVGAKGRLSCVNREVYCLGETPNLFRMEVLEHMYDHWAHKTKTFHASADIMELISANAQYIIGGYPGTHTNIKLTHPMDYHAIRSYVRHSKRNT